MKFSGVRHSIFTMLEWGGEGEGLCDISYHYESYCMPGFVRGSTSALLVLRGGISWDGAGMVEHREGGHT